MSLLDKALGLVGLERRSDVFDTFWSDFVQMRAGVAVTPESAQSVAACYAAIGAIAEAIGSLPLHLYRRSEEGRVRAAEHPLYGVLHHAPNDQQSAVEWREWMTASMLATGNAYSRIVRGSDGQVRQLQPLPAERVVIMRKGDTIGGYEYTDRDGKKERLLPAEVFHLRHRAGADPLVGVSPIQAARAVIELAMAEANHGLDTFEHGAKLSGILQAPGRLNTTQRQAIASAWGAFKSGKTPVIDDGLTYQPISMSLEDSEWVAARRFSVEEVARIFKIPPVLIGDLSHANYSNSTEMYRWFITHTLKRHMSAWEGAISRQLLTPAAARTLYPEFNAEGMLRGDSKTRAEFYKLGIESGWMTVEEVRQLESMPKLPSKYQPMQAPKGAAQ